MHLSILHLQFWNEFLLFYFIVIGFPPASIPYKPLVLLFLPHVQFGGLEKNPESVNRKIETDQGNDMTIADSCSTSKRAPSYMLWAFWILGFRKFQMPIPNTNIIVVFHSVLLIPDLLMSFFLDSKQVQGYDIVCMLIIV